MPLVSILIPVYDGEPFLARALDSACAQTHQDIEILVGDDCSTDGSRALAEAYAATDPRIRVLETAGRNLGAADNQLRLHQAARGAFLKPLLQDDLLAPECVATLLAPLLADDRIVLSTSKRGLVDAAGARLPDEPWTAALTAQDATLNGTSYGDTMLAGTANLVGEVTTVLYRAGVVAPEELWRLGGHDYRANADIVLWLKLLAGRLAFYTPRELSSFRQHASQSSQSPAVMLAGRIEWARMALAARTHGYLRDPAQEHAALLRAAQLAGGALPAAAAHPELLADLTAALTPLLARLDVLGGGAAAVAA